MPDGSAIQSDLVLGGGNAILSDARLTLALEATWEIEKLSQVMRTVVDPNDRMEAYAIRGLSIRVEELSHIIMGALGDEVEKTKDLAFKLRREREREAEA